jgi:hypothetical protein
MRSGYKILRTTTGASLMVPKDVVELIPEGARFECEITEEGLLYRLRQPSQPEQLPRWAKRKAAPDA